MSLRIIAASLCGLVISAAPIANVKTQIASGPLAGDYVEARTASVFAGACHYNGEYMYTGNDAILAWRFNSGSFKGVDLTGVTVMAEVSSDSNLADHAARRSDLCIDTSATPAQKNATVALLREKYSASLGTISSVQSSPVTFHHDSSEFTASAAGFGSIDVQSMPNGECCKQPYFVWYSPIMNLSSRMVGYTQTASYDAARVTDQWSREGENSSFYGKFSF